MQRREFVLKSGVAVAALAATLAGCTANNNSGNDDPAAERRAINSSVDDTLSKLYTQVSGSRELVSRARGVLVFPNVVKAGLIVGGEYGRGSLRVAGTTTGYYSTTAVSVGLQAGAQSKALIFLFMTQDSLDTFRNRDGWSAGADASVAVLKLGANGAIDTTTATAPVEVIVLANAGLMADLSVDGTKVTKLKI
ncbi:SH3 domain-containing YSC84-like protein 1 [Pararobbsia alpina]|uniref:BPSL1445 family SYLF domain-containing lipoprotein n=1 Tax=Pararobbsia alpina TaxID=621374 RepID=UPI0039A4EA2E